MNCSGCGNNKDIVFWVTDGKEERRYCRGCRSPKNYVPDVFWDGKPEVNLADDPNTGKPRVFSSKGEKAAYLKERGLREAGDKVRGAPVMIHQNQNIRTDSKHEVKMALKRVKEMGIDRRRQEYYRIMKQKRG